VCCRVLQCVAVCCSVLQCVADLTDVYSMCVRAALQYASRRACLINTYSVCAVTDPFM